VSEVEVAGADTGSPGSHDAEGEGGKAFNTAQSGRRADLLASPEEARGQDAEVSALAAQLRCLTVLKG
jgi:hypothetical protein